MLLATLSGCIAAFGLRAQCSLGWVPNSGLPATGYAIANAATLWDSDGAGPAQPKLVVGGTFTLPAPIGATNIAVQELTTGLWSALPGWTFGSVTALAALPNGELWAAGNPGFGGTSYQYVVARWNGTAWQTMTVANERIFSMLAARNGDLYIGGAFTGINSLGLALGIARWNGSTWSVPGSGMGSFAFVAALAELPNGDVVAGGSFSSAGGVPTPGIARWSGTAWSALGSGFGGLVVALAVAENGDLYAGGSFTNGVGRWDGTVWSLLGSASSIGALHVLPDADVVAAGFFSPSLHEVKRRIGTTWTPFAVGLDTTGVKGFVPLPNGDLAIYGDITAAGGQASAGIAVLRASCAATVSAAGAGCPSSGGANTLTATALPWIGGTFRARGDGLPSLALVSIVTGLSPASLPLATILPQGQPGCDLLVSPDFVTFAVASAGSVQTALALPNSSAIVGIDFFQQLNPFEIDAALNILAVTASNALRMRIGAF